jgi:hypothetical protein
MRIGAFFMPTDAWSGCRLPETVTRLYTTHAAMHIGRDKGGGFDLDIEDKAPCALAGTVKNVVVDLGPAHQEGEENLYHHHGTQAVVYGLPAETPSDRGALAMRQSQAVAPQGWPDMPERRWANKTEVAEAPEERIARVAEATRAECRTYGNQKLNET